LTNTACDTIGRQSGKTEMFIPLTLWIALQVLGFALALLVSPWFLVVNIYIVPVLRFNYWASFSLLIVDCTFGTEDGGLHAAGGPIVYLLLSPLILADFIKKRTRFDDER